MFGIKSADLRIEICVNRSSNPEFRTPNHQPRRSRVEIHSGSSGKGSVFQSPMELLLGICIIGS